MFPVAWVSLGRLAGSPVRLRQQQRMVLLLLSVPGCVCLPEHAWLRRQFLCGLKLTHKVSLMLQMINKLLYRSRQRGFLELDLLVGLWAEQEVPKMDTHMLQQFTVVLDQVSSCKRPAAGRGAEHCCEGAPSLRVSLQENPDLFKWLTGQQEPPNEMQGNSAFKVNGGATAAVSSSVPCVAVCQQARLACG